MGRGQDMSAAGPQGKRDQAVTGNWAFQEHLEEVRWGQRLAARASRWARDQERGGA